MSTFVPAPAHLSSATSGSGAKTLKVIACGDPANERQFIIPQEVLCISSILKDYVENPDTTPPGLKRKGKGTLTLNNEGDVVEVLLEYLTQAHDNEKFAFRSSDRGVVFSVRLYKLALSLAYDLDKLQTIQS
jgi:hypothetical protein